MKKSVLLVIAVLIVSFGCQPASTPTPVPPTPIPPTPTPTTSRFEGELSQANKNATIKGTVTLSSGITSTSAVSVTTEIDTLNHFSFADLKPGSYHLDVEVVATPCFLGAPGQVFNGMLVSFLSPTASAVGLSFKNGSSSIQVTDVFTITTAGTIKTTYALPRCY